MQNIFQGIFDSSVETVISVPNFLLCVGVSLFIGVFLAKVYMYKSRYTNSFVLTLSLLPAIVCVVIMMVNGNVGAGVAVAGAFSLVRFRSVPGTAREIGTIFLAMGAGLVAGMGYLAYAVLFSLLLGGVMFCYQKWNIVSGKDKKKEKTLRVILPENLDYTEVFQDIFEEYTESVEEVCVKTTNMGSLFHITYYVTLKKVAMEKQFLDAIRCRNGNLEVNLSRQENQVYEL